MPKNGQATTSPARHAPNTQGVVKGLMQMTNPNAGPEKVHVLQTKHAESHTTYMGQTSDPCVQGDLECMKIGRGHINGLNNPNVPTQEPVHYNMPKNGQATTAPARHAPNTQGIVKGLM